MTYTVVAGDSLGKIARKFDTTVDVLVALNPRYEDDPDLIRVGNINNRVPHRIGD